MKVIFLFIFSIFTCVQVFAQGDDIKSKINLIKKSKDFLYAEVTTNSQEDAKALAERKLFDEVRRWMSKSGSSNVEINKGLFKYFTMPRGANMHRSFVYVLKKDLHDVPQVIKDLSKYTLYKDMVENMKIFKENGKISSYGRYASLENPEKCYLFIYNRNGEIIAVLTAGSSRINLNTKAADSVKNYSGCGAIGIEI